MRLDTGSTDDTVDILRRLGAKVKVKTYKVWSFAVARNDSMDMVSPDAEILFTLDLDETIKPGWRKTLEDAWIEEEKKGGNPVGCIYKYVWSWTSAGQREGNRLAIGHRERREVDGGKPRKAEHGGACANNRLVGVFGNID